MWWRVPFVNRKFVAHTTFVVHFNALNSGDGRRKSKQIQLFHYYYIIHLHELFESIALD